MFVLIEQLGNELIWLEWMLDSPSARPFRMQLELLQRSIISAMDALALEQPMLAASALHDINLHFQAIRNAIAHDETALPLVVKAACHFLETLRSTQAQSC